MSLQNVFRDKLPRHSHNLSEARYFDMDMGVLTPIYIGEMYPGDKVRISERAVLETRTLDVPLKSNITYREYWFFVPRRLMWKNWEKFIFGGKTGDFTAVPPFITAGSSGSSSTTELSEVSIKSLYDYFGLPVPPDYGSGSVTTTQGNIYDFLNNVKIDAMPFAAYQMIWKDWFRNENFSNDAWDFENAGQAWLSDGANHNFKNEDGISLSESDVGDLFTKRNVPWSRNYFTAALPFRQRGTANRVPLHGSAFVYAAKSSDGVPVPVTSPVRLRVANFTSPVGSTGSITFTTLGGNTETKGIITSGDVAISDTIEPSDNKYLAVNGSELQGFTINELRLLAKLQEFQEINARFGFRYIEGLRGHFGVSPTDARLDRPEFIGGFRQEVVVSEILQTSETGSTPLGTPAGRGISAGGGRVGSYFAEEHGLIIGLASIMPQQIFTQGIPRFLTRHTKEEFFSPEFNGLSEQEIAVKELFATPSMSANELNAVWGFVPAWEELRHGKTMAVGNLRNPHQADLFAWTMARHLVSAPTLGESFLFASQNNSNGGIRLDAWTTGNAASPFFVSLQHIIRKTSTVSKSGVPGITRI